MEERQYQSLVNEKLWHLRIFGPPQYQVTLILLFLLFLILQTVQLIRQPVILEVG